MTSSGRHKEEEDIKAKTPNDIIFEPVFYDSFFTLYLHRSTVKWLNRGQNTETNCVNMRQTTVHRPKRQSQVQTKPEQRVLVS